MKKAMLCMGLMMAAGFAGNARAAVIFSDDFAGNNGDPVDSSKWEVATQNSGTVSIQDNAAVLHGKSDWAKGWLTSKTGATFLTPGSTATYSGSICFTGLYPSASLGVADAVTLNMVKNGSYGDASLNLSIPGIGTVWTGSWSGINLAKSYSITLTPMTYAVTLEGATTSSGSLNGLHGLSPGSYTGEGKISFYAMCSAGWDNINLIADNVQIDYVPEPASLSLLALGLLGFSRRR